MRKKTGLCLLLACGIAMLALAPTAHADVHPGLRTGAYTSAAGFMIGGDLLIDLGPRNWYFNPNVEYVWADERNEATFNFDFHYDLPTNSSLYYWVGGGAAVVFIDHDSPHLGTETDPGLNLFMGIGFNKGGHIIPYIQPKVLISDHSDFVITFGLRF